MNEMNNNNNNMLISYYNFTQLVIFICILIIFNYLTEFVPEKSEF